MTYALIGSGNMAWLIASRMLSGGHTCVGVWGRNADATDKLCAAFSLPRLHTLSQFHDGTDACIVAVADSGIADVVKDFSLRRTTLIHTAGSMPVDVLSAHTINAGVVWPVYSIRKDALPDHRYFPALIEANTQDASEIVRAVAKAICDTAYEVSGEQRQWLHLAAVMSNNFVNHLLAVATDICDMEDLPVSLLQPLLDQTIAGTRIYHPQLLQTGPARRHDAATLSRHLSMLEGQPQWQNLYRSLSAAIMEQFPMPSRG
jgi:predicted short-subunit dehydrogenase-like oxidoreductase (DUF2520 family)